MPALDGVSFSVPAGSRVALVGAVASGKSTLLRVLAGMLPLESGRCELGGREIRERDWGRVRARIGYVPQESLLVSESITDNVAFGRDVSPQRVQDCLAAAQLADDVARMPDGAETVLGRGGRAGLRRSASADRDRASAGRSARAAAARRLHELARRAERGPAVGGDRARLPRRDGVRRLAPTDDDRRADTILVLDRGRLVDRGTHDELVSRCEEYTDFLLREEAEAALARQRRGSRDS